MLNKLKQFKSMVQVFCKARGINLQENTFFGCLLIGTNKSCKDKLDFAVVSIAVD